jgi:hypothetical protein
MAGNKYENYTVSENISGDQAGLHYGRKTVCNYTGGLI